MKRMSVLVLVALGIGLLWLSPAVAGENRVNILCSPIPPGARRSSGISARPPASRRSSCA